MVVLPIVVLIESVTRITNLQKTLKPSFKEVIGSEVTAGEVLVEDLPLLSQRRISPSKVFPEAVVTHGLNKPSGEDGTTSPQNDITACLIIRPHTAIMWDSIITLIFSTGIKS